MHTAAKTVVSKPPNPAYRDERSFAAVVSNAKPSDDSQNFISDLCAIIIRHKLAGS